MHRLRLAMKADGDEMLSGEVEADETFVGGKKHREMKTNVLGWKRLAHGPAKPRCSAWCSAATGRARAAFARWSSRIKRPRRSFRDLRERQAGSVLYTDALRSYRQTDRDYIHEFIDHSLAYVEGRVHTNTIENFWSCVKRTLHGTYIAVRPFRR
jgi:hypothetical protein